MRRFVSRVLLLMGTTINRVANRIYQSPQEIRTCPWFRANGDKTLRLDYDLDPDSIVFDLGGYEGQWSSDIFAKYNCFIHVFEPVQEFATQIERRFAKNKKIIVHRYGLANETKAVSVSLSKDSSSIFKQVAESEQIQLILAYDFMIKNNIGRIDLMKINIEGAEYDLLDHLIETGFVKNIVNLQIQFHDFVPDARWRMRSIQNGLEKTHKLTYQYEFVWENWELRVYRKINFTIRESYLI